MSDTHEESLKKLRHLIKDVGTAMLTTLDNGVLRARPMATQQTEAGSDLWFITSTESHKTTEIEKDNRVNVSYSSPSDNTYVSISGTASLVVDRAKIDELWSPIHKAWFPKGKDDPTICLLKVVPDQAEYWDSTSSTLVQIAGFIKAAATGKQADGGDNAKINL